MIPIVDEPGQPEDFTEILESIELVLYRLGLNWHSDRVVDYISKLHSVAGYTPATPEIARYALSYAQLQALLQAIQ